jgi:uncharacterized membrane protein HdeD (DUF308 family)
MKIFFGFLALAALAALAAAAWQIQWVSLTLMGLTWILLGIGTVFGYFQDRKRSNIVISLVATALTIIGIFLSIVSFLMAGVAILLMAVAAIQYFFEDIGHSPPPGWKYPDGT